MKRLLTTLAALSLLAFAPAAAADGLPLAVDSTSEGVVGPAGKLRYVTFPASRATQVVTVRTDGGRPLTSNIITGSFTVPAVAYDGSAAGLSADGRTLVLINPRRRFPRRHTTFAVLHTRSLRVRELVRLRGDFSFDALSPDGRSLYLINYLSRRDPTRYRVRVFDLERGRLAPKPIVDPREDPDEMNGEPITRATSPDGRWAYTLYVGREHPFIHALDTVGRKAVCIDLAAPPHGPDPYSFRLDVSPGGGELRVLTARRRPLAIVDTRTFSVSEPPAARPTDETSSARWATLAGFTALLLVVGFVLRRRRRRLRTTNEDWHRHPVLDGSGDAQAADPKPEPELAGRG